MLSFTSRRVERVRHELMRRELQVLRINPLTPGFVSITLGGDALASFVSLSFDDHVKVLLDETPYGPQRRDFTPRHFDRDARELTLEFALHAHGPACEWARQARVGDHLSVGGPKGSMILPLDCDWHLLVGDASALPAIHRRLEELPAGSRVFAIVQVAQESDRRTITSRADMQLQWVSDDAALLAALRALDLPAGRPGREGFAWAAGEAAVMQKVRDIILQEKHIAVANTRISAYWKRGAADFHDTL